MKMKLSSRKQLIKEATEILNKLRKFRQMNTEAISKDAALKAYLKAASQAGPKIKEVNFAKDPKKFANGYNGNNTAWRDVTLFSKRDATNIMKKALPNGYNEFKAEIMDKLPTDSKIQIGREGSVCLYVTTNTKLSKTTFKADELHEVSPGVYRIWWD